MHILLHTVPRCCSYDTVESLLNGHSYQVAINQIPDEFFFIVLAYLNRHYPFPREWPVNRGCTVIQLTQWNAVCSMNLVQKL